MHAEQTKIPDLLVIHPDIFTDERGYFFESYHQEKYSELGIHDVFVQDNHSSSIRNVVRGLHFQRPPKQQSKLVRVTFGEVFDVAVDLRPDSPTFKQWFGITLSEQNKLLLYIPVGFAHGFCVTSERADFQYKCGCPYDSQLDSGIRWNDPEIGIDWPVAEKDVLLSPKDAQLPFYIEMAKH